MVLFAGRKSSIAKKPYNPIIGETFRCRWKVPSATETTTAESDPPDLPTFWWMII